MTHLRLVAACFGFLVLLPTLALAQELFLTSCAEDTHIEPATKKSIDSAAMTFANAVLGSNPSNAFDLLSKAAQANTTPQQFDGTEAILRRVEPKNVAIQHTYFVELKGKSPGRVVCGNSFSNPSAWASLEAESVPQQAYTLLSADTVNNKLAIAIWLIPEQSGWKVHDFRMNVSTLGDEDSMQLLLLARIQQAKKHSFNAALLCAAAAQTANRGPSFQLGITQSISEEMSKFIVPDEIKGPPPFLWKNGERIYKVNNVGPIAIGGKLYVSINHEVSPWQSNEQVEGWNRELISYFKNRFPEYSDSFAGLVVRATERGSNRGYGTVEEQSSTKEQTRPATPSKPNKPVE